MSHIDTIREMERLAAGIGGLRGPRQMPMDLYRDGDHFILRADLPGIDPGTIDLDLDGQLLTIRAERTVADGAGVQWITRERAEGSFVRQLSLSRAIDRDRIGATYDNGVLTVTMPVSEAAKPRKIDVTSTGGAAHLELAEA